MKPVYAVKKRSSDSITAIIEDKAAAYQLRDETDESHYVEKHVVYADLEDRNR